MRCNICYLAFGPLRSSVNVRSGLALSCDEFATAMQGGSRAHLHRPEPRCLPRLFTHARGRGGGAPNEPAEQQPP